MLARQPKGIILSGGPKSVYVEHAPTVDPGLFAAGVPILGICYGAQLLTKLLGGEVAHTGLGEYGRTELVREGTFGALRATGRTPPTVWMSHGDSIVGAPDGFEVTGGDGRRRRGGARGPSERPSTASSSTPRWSTPSGARSC